MNANIIISGHSHELKAKSFNDVFLMNPGSITGSYTSKKGFS